MKFSITAPVITNGSSIDEDYSYVLPQILNLRTFQDRVRYPSDCIRSGIEGRVLLKLSVDEYGSVNNFWVIRN